MVLWGTSGEYVRPEVREALTLLQEQRKLYNETNRQLDERLRDLELVLAANSIERERIEREYRFNSNSSRRRRTSSAKTNRSSPSSPEKDSFSDDFEEEFNSDFDRDIITPPTYSRSAPTKFFEAEGSPQTPEKYQKRQSYQQWERDRGNRMERTKRMIEAEKERKKQSMRWRTLQAQRRESKVKWKAIDKGRMVQERLEMRKAKVLEISELLDPEGFQAKQKSMKEKEKREKKRQKMKDNLARRIAGDVESVLAKELRPDVSSSWDGGSFAISHIPESTKEQKKQKKKEKKEKKKMKKMEKKKRKEEEKKQREMQIREEDSLDTNQNAGKELTAPQDPNQHSETETKIQPSGEHSETETKKDRESPAPLLANDPRETEQQNISLPKRPTTLPQLSERQFPPDSEAAPLPVVTGQPKDRLSPLNSAQQTLQRGDGPSQGELMEDAHKLVDQILRQNELGFAAQKDAPPKKDPWDSSSFSGTDDSFTNDKTPTLSSDEEFKSFKKKKERPE